MNGARRQLGAGGRAFLWFARRKRSSTPSAHAGHPIACRSHQPCADSGGLPCRTPGSARPRVVASTARARAHQQAWRTAAFASFAVSALTRVIAGVDTSRQLR